MGKSFNDRLSKKRPLLVTYDNHCPRCREHLGWETLADEFHLQRFDMSRTPPMVRIECPGCHRLLDVELCVDFAVHETGKRRKRT